MRLGQRPPMDFDPAPERLDRLRLSDARAAQAAEKAIRGIRNCSAHRSNCWRCLRGSGGNLLLKNEVFLRSYTPILSR